MRERIPALHGGCGTSAPSIGAGGTRAPFPFPFPLAGAGAAGDQETGELEGRGFRVVVRR
jgi:hypothetical protein